MIPRRKVTLLVGDQEMGKSFFALDLAARLTRGESIPPAPRLDDGPGSVLILEGDDESDDTLYPRLDFIGADLQRVYTLTVDGPRNIGRGLPQISLAHSVECIRDAARRIGDCRLIIIDPVTAFIDGISANSHDAVRRLFSRLTHVAKVTDAAVLIISHNRKSGADSALHRAIGCLAFTIAARVVFTIVADPTSTGRRLLLPAKMNLQPASRCPGRAFHIHQDVLHWDPDPVNLRPDELKELLATGLATSERLLQVVDWLRTLLKDGPVPSNDVHARAAGKSIPRMLLFKAKARAGIRAVRDGRAQRWQWELPAELKTHPATPTRTADPTSPHTQ
jgi:KaiC/GvpD/RAD55 family RecA-like ATPase